MKMRLTFQVQDTRTDRTDDIRRDELSSVNLVHLAVELKEPWGIVRPTPVETR